MYVRTYDIIMNVLYCTYIYSALSMLFASTALTYICMYNVHTHGKYVHTTRTYEHCMYIHTAHTYRTHTCRQTRIPPVLTLVLASAGSWRRSNTRSSGCQAQSSDTYQETGAGLGCDVGSVLQCNLDYPNPRAKESTCWGVEIFI